MKEKNTTVNKKGPKITTKYKSMLHLWKTFHKKLAKDKNHRKVRESITIVLVYTDARHIAYVI